MIEVKKVSRVFGKKENVFIALKDISFSIPEGSIVAIVGKSGSGKSTLMHVMSGLDHPSTGEVTMDDISITKLKRKALDNFRATEMSFIFQAFFVEGNQTCYQNVSMPLEIAKIPYSRRSKLVTDALERVELSNKKNEKAKNLSGGQKQRLAIARAIVGNPKLIFADEPTGNLDSATGDKIMKFLFDTTKKLGATLFIVTHDQDLASKCQIQIKLHDGTIESITGLPKQKAGK